MAIRVPGIGPFSPKLMIVGESPAANEVAAGLPFVGPSGKMLNDLLTQAGISRSSCWLTNVCKYQVRANYGDEKIPFATRAKMDGINLEEQINELQVEINNVKPNCILGLGGTALWAITGKTKISDYRGSIIQGMGRKCVFTYHPAHLLHSSTSSEVKGDWNKYVIILDMKRALDESQYAHFDLPKRNLSICQSSAQLLDFKNRYKHAKHPAVDIEAWKKCIPACIAFAFTPNEGLSVPLWNFDGMSSLPDSEIAMMWIIVAEILSGNDIIGANFKYDQDKIKRLGFITRSLISDTMLKAFTINPELPKNLAFNTSIYTREPFYKNEGMYEGSIEDLMIGNARDACVTKEVDIAQDKDIDELGLRKFYENFVMKLHPFYLDIEQEGFVVDYDKRDELLAKYIKWNEENIYEMWQLTGVELNTNSYPQMNKLIYENLKLGKQGRGTGEEVLTEFLNSAKLKDEHRRLLTLILENRRVKKTINTYIWANPDYDGKMRTTYFPCLETGRSKTGQLEPPIRPKVDPVGRGRKVDLENIGIAFQTITKHGDIGHDVRYMYGPEKGYIFLQADSSQAEARVVFLLANDEQALKDIDEHDYHALTASWFFGGCEADYSKRILGFESPIRFAGKTLRHAGHLGASKRRAAISVNTDARKYKIPISITEATADMALKVFHKKQPSIQQVFHKGIQDSLMNGRRVLIAGLPYGIDAPCGGKRTFFEKWNDELFRQAYSYIPQRSVSDNTKNAGIRLKERIKNLRILVESHDALLFMVPENRVDDYAPIIKEEFERSINFSNCSMSRRALSIPCEIEIGYNYKELSKFKFIAEKSA